MLRTLFLALLVSCALASLPAGASANEPVLENTERENYLNQLKRQHATDNERTALLAQINSLLSEHALLRGYQIGYKVPEDILYSARVPRSGTLQIREERRSTDGQLSVKNHQISVYGLDPFFSYNCNRKGIDCSILHNSQRQPLLHIVRHPDAAAELVKALSYLMRDLQRQ